MAKILRRMSAPPPKKKKKKKEVKTRNSGKVQEEFGQKENSQKTNRQIWASSLEKKGKLIVFYKNQNY